MDGAGHEWRIATDDRTGAFEVAAEMVPVAGPVLVTVGQSSSGAVVDLGTRDGERDAAAEAAADHERACRGWRAHKIDSLLRGHWTAELLARVAVSGRRTVLVPAWPAMGRTCIGGVVHVHGRPIGRPGEALGADELGDVEQVLGWLDLDRPAAVCDVAGQATLIAIAEVLAGHDVLVAGPAGSVAAVGRAWLGGAAGSSPAAGAAVVEPPSVVVCASASPVAHRQLDHLRRTYPEVEVISADPVAGPLDPATAHAVAQRARTVIDRVGPQTVVVVGGATAAALLGVAPRLVGGVVAAGMPWSRDEHGGGPLVISKAGAFGATDALTRLFSNGPLPSRA